MFHKTFGNFRIRQVFFNQISDPETVQEETHPPSYNKAN